MPKKGPSSPQDRISRIQGQLNGIKRMLDEEAEYDKVMMQLKAVASSIDSLKISMVKERVRSKAFEELDKALKNL